MARTSPRKARLHLKISATVRQISRQETTAWMFVRAIRSATPVALIGASVPVHPRPPPPRYFHWIFSLPVITQKWDRGPIEVRGHTLPNATVDVEVTAGIFGLTQRIFENSVKADSQGNFNFTFQPQLKVRGARYEVNVRATKDKETRERTLSLVQQR